MKGSDNGNDYAESVKVKLELGTKSAKLNEMLPRNFLHLCKVEKQKCIFYLN